MSSSLPTSNALQTQVTRTGRARRPTEKVQAILEEHGQAKHASEHQAREKAKRREMLSRKREQASKAAELDPVKVPTRAQAASPVDIEPDNAFTTRSIGSVHTTNTRPALFTAPLVVRQGRVPPASGVTGIVNMQTTSAKSTGALSHTSAQLAKSNGLERKKAYLNVLEASPPKKRARKRDSTPYSPQIVAVVPGDLSLDDSDEDSQLPRKRMHRSISSTDVDELNDCILPGLETTGGGDLEDKKRFKASNLTKAERAVLQTAIEIYCASLLCNDPYPSAVKETEWARAAWVKACRHHQVDFPVDFEKLKLISIRTTHIRGQFKTKARDAVTKVYDFQASADASAIERNRALYLQLKQDSAFIFRSCGKTLDEHTGLYLSPAIQQVIDGVLFKPKNSEGIRWARYYQPFPVPGFALAITAIECAINEWESGISRMIVFKEHEYSTVYARHLSSLNEFRALTESTGQLTKLLEQVYRNGCTRAGVINSAIETGVPTKAVPTRAFLNAINDYERMEGATGQPSAAEPEDDSVEQLEPNDGGVVNGEESDLDPAEWGDGSLDGELYDD